jgi:hypothetical protein
LRLKSIHLRYKQIGVPRKPLFSGAFFTPGLKKPLFQPTSLRTFTLD